MISYRIIRTTLLLSMEVFEPFPGYYFFNILLMVLQVLHVFWAGLILRMVYKFLKGKVRISEKAKVGHEIHTAASLYELFSFSKVCRSVCFSNVKSLCICFCPQLEKDERSDEESGAEEEEEEKEGDKNSDQDCYWEKSKETLNSKLSMLTNSCVLNNLTHRRSSVAKRIRKAQ